MNEEQRARDAINKGDAAERIMRDPAVISALDGMRQKVYHNIATSHHKQTEERETLYLMLKAIEGFEREFKDAINGGKKAKSRLANLFKAEQSAGPIEQSEPVETPQGDTETDEPRYTVKVSGEEREVSLDELRKGYMMESDYRKKTSEVSERRAAIEQKESQIEAQLRQAEELLDLEVSALESEEMQQLREDDPDLYLREVDKVKAKADSLAKLREDRAAENQEKAKERATQELELLTRAIPDWLDEGKRREEGAEVFKHLEGLGYTQEELGNLLDHRVLVLARNSMILNKNLESKRVNTPPKTQKPGTTTNTSGADEKLKSARAKLRKTGSMRDAQAAIKALME